MRGKIFKTVEAVVVVGSILFLFVVVLFAKHL